MSRERAELDPVLDDGRAGRVNRRLMVAAEFDEDFGMVSKNLNRSYGNSEVKFAEVSAKVLKLSRLCAQPQSTRRFENPFSQLRRLRRGLRHEMGWHYFESTGD